jgi:antirestriction protein
MNGTTPVRIYVASLADYNNGLLHGLWIDVTDPDTMRDEIAAMLRASKYPNVMVECPDCDGSANECKTCQGKGEVPSAEEYAVHDYECLEGDFDMGEYPDLEALCAMAEAIEEHGAPFLAWHNAEPHYNTDPDKFLEQFRGEWSSLADFVADFWEQSGFEAEPWPHPSNYVDWEKIAHDWEMNGDVRTIDAPGGKVWIFDNQ